MKLKVWFTDFWPEWQYEDFIYPILNQHFDVTLSKNNPDVLFISIFGNDSLNYNCKKIAFFGENIHYQYNERIRNNIKTVLDTADFRIGFEPHTEYNFQLPLWQAYILKDRTLQDKLYNRLNHSTFERWCAFTHSNGSNFIRNSAFLELNAYKRVHSYGKLYTNDFSLQNMTTDAVHWKDKKTEFFNKHTHKFMFAYENSYNHYYCTEKLMHAFIYGSVPIYWGDFYVGEYWNENAFINVTKHGLDAVKKVDADDELFEYIYRQPVFRAEQKEMLENNLADFELWLVDKIKQ